MKRFTILCLALLIYIPTASAENAKDLRNLLNQYQQDIKRILNDTPSSTEKAKANLDQLTQMRYELDQVRTFDFEEIMSDGPYTFKFHGVTYTDYDFIFADEMASGPGFHRLWSNIPSDAIKNLNTTYTKLQIKELTDNGMTLEEAVKELIKRDGKKSDAILTAATEIDPNFDFTKALSSTASGNEKDSEEANNQGDGTNAPQANGGTGGGGGGGAVSG